MALAQQDVRWLQRLNNYSQALGRLAEAVELAEVRALTPLELPGLIQAFEFTHELAWNVLKDYFSGRVMRRLPGRAMLPVKPLPRACSMTERAGWR